MVFSRIFILLLFFHFACDFTNFFSKYISVMDSVKQNLNVTKEKLDEKEAELEAANTEVAVLKETISALKSGLAIKSDNCAKR